MERWKLVAAASECMPDHASSPSSSFPFPEATGRHCCLPERDRTSNEEDQGGARGSGGHGADRPARSAAASVFSKWLMVLERSHEPHEQDDNDDKPDQEDGRPSNEAGDDCSKAPSVPPPNALLLMRCRSAPAKGLTRKGAEPAGEEAAQEKGGVEEKRDELVFMRTAPDFLKLSIDIAKETWVVGGVDPLARSRSWKR
ncbi:hypothetical protein TRIUR3_22325 [Triticum urartu]|uniref:Uncharacterized protein n=1 Tax=Triticum urartu TaxID=4572 RepID=M7ZS85_TRIUA|nr:hypothetical protein TRIUR3_22325 [Triticum urartu]